MEPITGFTGRKNKHRCFINYRGPPWLLVDNPGKGSTGKAFAAQDGLAPKSSMRGHDFPVVP
jgi:hypothetical protein